LREVVENGKGVRYYNTYNFYNELEVLLGSPFSNI